MLVDTLALAHAGVRLQRQRNNGCVICGEHEQHQGGHFQSPRKRITSESAI